MRSFPSGTCSQYAEPICTTDWVGEIEELAFAESGAGEELDREAGERVGMLAGGAQQLRGRGVIDEPGHG